MYKKRLQMHTTWIPDRKALDMAALKRQMCTEDTNDKNLKTTNNYNDNQNDIHVDISRRYT
jgi:hypothetical protein